MPSAGFLVLLLLPLVEGAPVTTEEAAEYLQKFGYIQPSRLMAENQGRRRKMNYNEEEPDDQETQYHNAVKTFQERFGIEETGELDEATREMMAAPRCGVPDVASLINYGGKKWTKNILTYSVDNRGSGMPESMTRSAIKSAFAVYSAVTPLKFREVNFDADIKISFRRGDHECFQSFDGEGRTLAHAYYPQRGVIHFDADERWAIMDEDNMPTDTHTNFLTVATHEIGHALGLDHSRVGLMSATYSHPWDSYGNYKSPRLDSEALKDIQRLYGAAARPPVNEERSGCANKVYAALSLPNSRIMLFPERGHNVLEINGRTRQIIQKISVAELFDEGPSQVTAAYFDDKTSRIMLFLQNKVWAYHLDLKRLSITFVEGYPLRLPVGDFWQTGAAFDLSPRAELVSYEGRVATYDEATNTMKAKGHISEVYPNMPEHAAGFAHFNAGSWFLFSESKVFKYNFNLQTTQDLGSINDFLNC